MTAITLNAANGIAELVLSNPGRHNSLDDEFWNDLGRHLEQIADESSIRAIVLAGAGENFSSGIDLAFAGRMLATDASDEGRARDRMNHNIRWLQDVFFRLERCRVPVIAAVQGACIGAGLELVCTADIRVCSRDAFFQLMEVRLGLIADLGGLQRLARQVPMGVARELAYTGRRFSAEEALGWGFVNQVAESGAAALAAARAVAGQIAANSPLAVKYIKESLVAEDSLKFEHELRRASIVQTAYGHDLFASLAALKKGAEPQYADLELAPPAGVSKRS
jgi:enoyl-CoA hydratase/carnithine racemase